MATYEHHLSSLVDPICPKTPCRATFGLKPALAILGENAVPTSRMVRGGEKLGRAGVVFRQGLPMTVKGCVTAMSKAPSMCWSSSNPMFVDSVQLSIQRLEWFFLRFATNSLSSMVRLLMLAFLSLPSLPGKGPNCIAEGRKMVREGQRPSTYLLNFSRNHPNLEANPKHLCLHPLPLRRHPNRVWDLIAHNSDTEGISFIE